MPDSTSLTTTQPASFAPTNLSEAFKFADMVLMSGMAPKSYTDIFANAKTAEEKQELCEKARSAVVVALQLGLEVGFQPMQALQSIASINGMPTIWGDGALGLVKSKGVLEYIMEDDIADITKSEKATCRVKRKGEPNEHVVTFSYADAKAAGIRDRNVWKTYPARMCQMRARAFALRNVFPDVLKGLAIREEVEDYQTIDAVPSQPKPQGQIAVPKPAAQVVSATVTPDKEEKPQEAAVQTEEVAATAVQDIAPEDDPEVKKQIEAEAKQWATGYYAAYKEAGKTPEESKAFLKKNFNIEDSRQVPSDKREFAMAQAKQGFPCMKEGE